jgi:hypothetical protein
MTPTPAATRQVRAWVRSALNAESGSDIERAASTNLEPVDLFTAVLRHRVAEVLEPHVDVLNMSVDVAQSVRGLLRHNRPRLLMQRLELARLAELLADVDWLSIKGPVLAVQTTGDPAARGGGDIDILVRTADVESIYRRLTDRGWRVRPVGSAMPGTWAWRHVLNTTYEMTFDGPHSTVDLHWRLGPTHQGLPDFDALWARREKVQLGDLTLDAMSPSDTFVHSCHHAAKDRWRSLRSLVDIHRLARNRELWTNSLGRLEVATLAVVDASTGLPSGIPDVVLRRAHETSSGLVERALASQESPLRARYPFPGAQACRDVRFRLRASRTPTDLRCAAVAFLLPAKAVAELYERTVWTAVPHVILRRFAFVVRRVVGWVRRQPGAFPVRPVKQP